MVFPVVLYRCESWTIKKAEHQRCFQIVALEMTLKSPLHCKEIKPVNPKVNQSWIFIGRTDEVEASILLATWCKELLHWKRPWCREKLKGKGATEDEIDSITDSVTMNFSKFQETVKNRGDWCATVHGITKSRTQLNNFTFTFHFHALEKEMATH